MIEITCDHCGSKDIKKDVGHVNRSRKLGMNLYCSRKCMGLARRVLKTIEQKKEEKRLYDAKYRAKNLELIKAKKAAHFKKVYQENPEKFRAERVRRRAAHAEYCRQPEYREWKHVYDRKRYAKKAFGPLWEIHVLAMDINEECLKRQTRFELMQSKGTINKAQLRRRKWINSAQSA